MKATCTHCAKQLPNPYLVSSSPYCNKQCFHDHMNLLTDQNILQRFREKGTADFHIKELKSMTRQKLLTYNRNERKYQMTPRAQKILEMNMLDVS